MTQKIKQYAKTTMQLGRRGKAARPPKRGTYPIDWTAVHAEFRDGHVTVYWERTV